jgi:hypothetical protein
MRPRTQGNGSNACAADFSHRRGCQYKGTTLKTGTTTPEKFLRLANVRQVALAIRKISYFYLIQTFLPPKTPKSI